MNKKYLYLLIMLVLAVSCSFTGNKNDADNSRYASICPEGINLKPMYGKVKKCKQQAESDKDFIEHCRKEFGDLKRASMEHVGMGWQYFNKGDVDTAIKRFNQAWLLDSLNADVYWGFASVEGTRGKTDEAIKLFDKSLELNPNNTYVWTNLATAYSNKFREKYDVKYLDETIKCLKKAIALSPKNEDAYRMITIAYSHYNQKDSLKEYLKLTDQLNPDIIDAETRKQLLR